MPDIKETAAAAVEEGTFVETERASERRNEMRMETVMTLLWPPLPSKGRQELCWKGEQRMSSTLPFSCLEIRIDLSYREAQKAKP